MNKLNVENEKNSLNLIAQTYTEIPPYSKIKKDIIFEFIDSIIVDTKDKKVLQLGCASGYETKCLTDRFGYIDSIDGSSILIENLQNDSKYNKVNFICSLFEEYMIDSDHKYDIVLCNYVLEHVNEPIDLLKHIKKNLIKHDGLLFVVVPNSDALSRRIAVEMNIINSLGGLTENDIRHGHKRVYNSVSLENDIIKSGFKIIQKKGVIFKILADFQLNKLLLDNFLTKEHIHALNYLVSENDNIGFSDSFFLAAKI